VSSRLPPALLCQCQQSDHAPASAHREI
jgi:hypothetical protein